MLNIELFAYWNFVKFLLLCGSQPVWLAFLFVYESVCREMQLVSGVFADLIVRNVFVYRCCKSDARDVSFLCVARLCVSLSVLRRFLFCVRESWRLFVGIVLTCCVRMVLFAFLNSPGSERCLSYVKCRTAFCPLHNGLQVIRHAYPLFYMVGKAGWKGIDGCSVMRNGLYRSAERCLWCCGTVRFGWWERLFHCTEEPFSPSGRAFSGWNDGCDGEAGGHVLMCDSV